MREIEFKVYEYDELNDAAKKVAVEECKQECNNECEENAWDDVLQTKRKFEDIFGVGVDLQSSSQGYYWREYFDHSDADGDNDLDIWDNKIKECMSNPTELWCDDSFIDTLDNFKFDKKYCYAHNVADLFVKFSENMNDEISKSIDGVTDNEVAAWIGINEVEFLENGKKYTE